MTQLEEFEKNGYFIVQEALSESDCDSLLAEVIESFHSSTPSAIKEPRYRRHSPMPLSAQVSEAITTTVEHGHDPLSSFLRNDQLLVELSSITVFPNAKAQPLHRDEANRGHYLVSVFINLAATSKGVGALQVMPGSHDMEQGGAGEAISLELPKGSAVFMNSKLLHAGGANTSNDQIRSVFYFSMGELDLYGSTYSIRDEVAQARMSLDEFRPRPGCRRLGFTESSRPLLSPGCRVLLPLCGDEEQLLLCQGTQLRKEMTLAEDQQYIADLLQLIEAHPQELEIRDLAAQCSIETATALTAITRLGREGWLRW